MRLVIIARNSVGLADSFQPAGDLHISFIENISMLAGMDADACLDMDYNNDADRHTTLLASGIPLVLVNAVQYTSATLPENFVRINAWPGFLQRPVAEVSMTQSTLLKAATEELLHLAGKKTVWVQDMCGMVTPRIVSNIINEAYFTLQEKISSREEIDMAMKTGTNYPYGPFEWAQKIGLSSVYELLLALSKENSRYTPCQLLKEEAGIKHNGDIWH